MDEGQRWTVVREHLIGRDLTKLRLASFNAIASTFDSCDFSGLRSRDVCFGAGTEQSVYRDCVFDGSRIKAIAPGQARFERCSFRDVRLDDWTCFGIELVDCTFSGVIKRLILNGNPRAGGSTAARQKHNEIRGNDFSGATLDDVAFRTGVDLRLQKMPQGPEYLYLPDGRAAVAELRKRATSVGSDELRSLATSVAELWGDNVNAGQDQLFVRRTAWKASAQTLFGEVLALVEPLSAASPDGLAPRGALQSWLRLPGGKNQR